MSFRPQDVSVPSHILPRSNLIKIRSLEQVVLASLPELKAQVSASFSDQNLSALSVVVVVVVVVGVVTDVVVVGVKFSKKVGS